ncbi:MAG: 2-amino-4-hydroxy-6-hydroxymethyldihydropteridine diphosphokinase [Hyphomicrobiaceae bacterium]|nr:2-amino-4-hydroxy-6-hydroxymethyldihydropteridine diphosphokinase [Hyphomicrobiaceae bacterium]
MNRTPTILLSLGANRVGAWGPPQASLSRAVCELEQHGLRLVGLSGLYCTEPVGLRWQPNFLNAVAGFEGSIGPVTLLRLVKRLERAAGRRKGQHMGPRPLDIDILDFRGRQVGRPGPSRIAGRLLLPHPEIAHRAFVLVPLAEVAPGWRHPWLEITARDLLRRIPGGRRGVVAVARCARRQA